MGIKGNNMKSMAIMMLICACGMSCATMASADTRDNYVGLRLHKNERIAYDWEPDNGHRVKMRDDNFGLGAYVGNRLTDNVKIEFETAYTGADFNKNGAHFNYDIWSNMLNVYLYQSFGGAVEPYAGLGLGLVGLWGDVPGGDTDATASLSWQAMVGVTFALNSRIDLNLGVKYQMYGHLEHKYSETKIDATELYIGAAYKFGLK